MTADTYEGFYTLENVDGSATTVELGTIANGFAADDTDATAYDTQADTGLQEIAINLGKVAADLAVLKSISPARTTTALFGP